MPRRKPKNITGIKGSGAVDYTTVYWVFECGKAGCDQLLKVSEDKPEYRVQSAVCTKCGFRNMKANIFKGLQHKYCRVCEQLQPFEKFDRHKPTGRSFRSGRQLECRTCKKLINAILNPKRTADQHREAAQRRRLYDLLSGETGKINSRQVFDRFRGRCFNCGKTIEYESEGNRSYHLDHTLPAKYLWPLTTANATLLCEDCNNAKHEKWPSEFYEENQLRRLSVLASIPYNLLSGPPKLNPEAVNQLIENVDDFIIRWIAYPSDIKKIRGLILEMEGLDIYDYAHAVPDFLTEDDPT